jgi:hypothetical protein
MNMCLTVGGEEEHRYGIGAIHRGIPHGRACPPSGGSHGGGQYPWPIGGRGVLELWSGCSAEGGGS